MTRKKRNLACCLFAGAVVFSGCSSPLITNPNLLATGKYNKIRYVSSAPQGVQELGRVEVSRRAEEASIRSALPALYEKGIERGGQFISDIVVKPTAVKELFDVPYRKCGWVWKRVTKRECKTKDRSVYEHKCEYVGGKNQCGPKLVSKPVETCTTVFEHKQQQECKTIYKKELRWVLYQNASGMVYGKP